MGGQPACQKACMKLMTNVFRNDDIGHPLQPISTDYITEILMALGGHKLKEFLDILNYDFLHARDKVNEKKPEPTPSLRQVLRTRRARVLASKAKKHRRRAQDVKPGPKKDDKKTDPSKPAQPKVEAQNVQDNNPFMEFMIEWATGDSKEGLMLGDYAKAANLVDINFATVINEA